MMASKTLDGAIEEIQAIISADGGSFEVLSSSAEAVHLRLDLANAECADCVLPPERLVEVIEASLRGRTGNDSIVVRIEDPRS
jgi:Fe-S cluster biogenesis protein NfuA